MAEHEFLQSVGVFKYSMLAEGLGKLVVEIEPDISHLQRVLIPKHFNVRSQRWAPHITVIRGDAVCDHVLWRAYEGQRVDFFIQILSITMKNSFGFASFLSDCAMFVASLALRQEAIKACRQMEQSIFILQ